MFNTEKLNSLVENSDLNRLQKTVTLGFIHRSLEKDDKESKDRELIREVGKCKNLSEVILSTDEVKIYSVSHNGDEWDSKYPFRCIYKKDDKWLRIPVVSPTFEVAFLNYMETKHIGGNSDFTSFACKMLDIDLNQYEK